MNEELITEIIKFALKNKTEKIENKELPLINLKNIMNEELITEIIKFALKNKTEKIENKELPFEIGKSYFIRTVTYHLIGKVKKIIGDFIEFEEDTISWVADSGRFSQAINNGVLDEVEPIKVKGGLNYKTFVDYYEWIHSLPRIQK